MCQLKQAAPSAQTTLGSIGARASAVNTAQLRSEAVRLPRRATETHACVLLADATVAC